MPRPRGGPPNCRLLLCNFFLLAQRPLHAELAGHGHGTPLHTMGVSRGCEDVVLVVHGETLGDSMGE